MKILCSNKFGFAVIKISVLITIQIAAFLLIYEAGYEAYLSMNGEIRRDVSFGIQLHYGTYLLKILAFINGAIQTFAFETNIKILSTIACSGVWLVFWENILFDMPYRASLVLFAGFLGFFSALLLLNSGGKVVNGLR